MGAGMEATSHYVPTVERMGSTSLTTDSCYQQMWGKKPANFIDGKFVYEKKVEQQGPGQVSDCVDIKWMNKNRPKSLSYAPAITWNYYAPLTG